MEDNQLEELKKIVAENTVVIKMLSEDMKNVKQYMRVRMIVSIIWIVVVILPTILAIIYLPGLVKDYTGGLSNYLDIIKTLY